MKKLFLSAIILWMVFSFSACAPKIWTVAQRSEFLQTCRTRAEGLGDRAEEYCSCLQKMVEAKYPNISKANRMSQKEKEAMTVECLK